MEKIKIEICVGTACYLLGAYDLMEAVESLPQNIQAYIDLTGATCLKACGQGPNVRVNGVLLTNMTPERLMKIIFDKINNIEINDQDKEH